MIPVISTVLVFVAAFLCATSLKSVWDGITSRYIADLEKSLDSLSIDRSHIPTILRWWGISLIAVIVILGILMRMPPLALGAAYLVFVSPRLILEMLIERRKTKLRDQMVGATVAIANGCRAGLSLAQALEEAAREIPEPLAFEFRRITNEYNCGRPLAEAIQSAKERLNLDSFTLFAMSLLVTIERGGKLTESLERISQSLQESQRLERKLAAETASGRNVVMLLTAFPFLFLGFVFITKPQDTMLVFQSLVGQIIMLVVMILVYVSVRWSNSILKLEL
ncbi:type II secretion system F family protein [Blastopirellula sp. JC732]|uniref:Type II secretion system F family protein n=1 Tax=Blastopirellula sediminis TaxID=2894196 RepID=A0A9X1MMJ2_9BACT|nr:type II secretion system F family protein [Blastopirellula sediminis]MCC9608581.1 type II secretion system F family protein [Blastopirellula sediminis]MCC9628642.1 type II secretion system F family protein [Blastopirellula sediminis]